jgi:PAS domain S-box-containing protein
MMDDKINILAVDDVEMNQSMLEFMLADVTDNFFKAGNGRQALDLLDRNPNIDIILLDLEMPVMDGFETLSRLKQSERFREIPVIVITSGKDEILRTLTMGANDFLSKPYNLEELKLRVKNHARSKKLNDLTRDINTFLDAEVTRKTAALEEALKEARQNAMERQIAENSFVQSEKRYRILFETANDALFLLEGPRVVDCNRKALEMFGCTAEEILGSCPWDFSADVQHDGSLSRGRITEFLDRASGGTPQFFEWQYIGKNGVPIDTEVSLNSLEHEGRSFIQSVIRDVTKRKKIEFRLLQSEKMASIGQLSAGVAHEINNPTGYVSSNLKTMSEYFDGLMGVLSRYHRLLAGVRNLAEKTEAQGELSQLLAEIELLEREIDMDYILKDTPALIRESLEGTERIKEIVRSLKNFAHPGEDRLIYSDINGNIDSTLNIVWNELKYKATVTRDYGELPEVQCYPQQLKQVFMNMLVNAAQAIKTKGGITIRTRSAGGNAEISISDTGAGIPKENICRIFDPFFTTKEVGKGTGLGLNVAYNIVKKHHGTIDVTSKVGEGTTFTIRLPVHQWTDSEGSFTSTP